MKSFYTKLLKTSNEANINIISDDHCCKLLAWLYGYGGANEAVLYNYKLNEDIKHSQERLNIFGGQIVNLELHERLQLYLKEVDDALHGKCEHPQFAYEICDYYSLSRGCIS